MNTLTTVLSFLFFIFLSYSTNSTAITSSKSQLFFQQLSIDKNGPVEPWGKAIGDINGDGLKDIIIGGHKKSELSFLNRMLSFFKVKSENSGKPELIWYENPGWKKHVISTEYFTRTDIEVADINNDGNDDVVISSDQGLIWFKNPNWEPVIISNKKYHDIEISDLNKDGIKEIIVRNQSKFGYENGDNVYIYYTAIGIWNESKINVPHGEGLKVKDVDGDTFDDIVINQVWLKNSGSLDSTQWKAFNYSNNWNWDDVKIQVADINGDNHNDIILTPAEPAAKDYHISWFESKIVNSQINWVEHIVDSNVETVYHSLATDDFDSDGDIDILTAEMNQSKKQGQIILYSNIGHGEKWEKTLLGAGGLHNIVATDIDGDHDVDFMGTNWKNADRSKIYPVSLWINNTHNKYWQKKIIDDELALNTLFVFTSDIDNDGDKDILSGDYVFRNSGEPNYNFIREKLGTADNNIVHVYDYDHDGDDDLLISKWQGRDNKPGLFKKILIKLKLHEDVLNYKGNNFQLALNDGLGNFSYFTNIPDAKGDFLQGTGVISIDGSDYVLLSWHKAGYGLQSYKIPVTSVLDSWYWSVLSKISQDEGLSISDIDLDGDEDILLGTKWLRNEGLNQWNAFNITTTDQKPDRNILQDINNDNRVDAIVGFEAISKPGNVSWYAQGQSVTDEWQEHVIAKIIGPMSLDVGDIDLDGDIDVVAGEHNLKFPELSRVFVFYNNLNVGNKWDIRVIQTGDEHHDGTKLFDYDNDGDLDVISIGWKHSHLNLYINPLN